VSKSNQPSHILLLTTKSDLDTRHEWLDDNLTTIFMQFLPKNPCYQLEPEHLIPTYADICPANAMLDNYANAIKKRINLQSTTQSTQQQFAHLPANQTLPLTTILYSAAAQKNTQPTDATTAPPKTKKTKRTDPINTTKHSHDTAQTSTTTTTHLNLQNDILTTIRAEV